MAHDECEFRLAGDDYDTALHIVESIRRKARRRASQEEQRNQRHRHGVAHKDNDDKADDYQDDDDDSVGSGASDNNDDNNNNDDDNDNDNDSDPNISNVDGFESASDCNSYRYDERRSDACADSSLPPAFAQQMPSPPPPQRSSTPKSHRALDALRIEPLVELHRIPSGRNLRLKHVTSSEASSPHALTPRAPSGRRPSERPSSWSSSSSSSSLVRQSETARPNFYRPQTNRSSSVESSPVLDAAVSRFSPARAVSLGGVHNVIPKPRELSRDAEAAAQLPDLGERQYESKPPPAAQDRRCSFTISALALKELGLARSSPPGPETAPIDENQQVSAVDAFARFQALASGGVMGESREPEVKHEEEEEKALYQFALWKKAGRRRQLPDAISTRCQQQQQQEEQQEANDWKTPVEPASRHRSSSNQTTSAVLRVDSGDRLSSEAFSRSDTVAAAAAGELAQSDSPSLHLAQSRSPTIGASRSFRRGDSPLFGRVPSDQ